MRRTKTRARPIDIYKKMTIIRDESLLPEDSETIDSAVVVSLIVCAPFAACPSQTLSQKTGKIDLPVPDVSSVPEYEAETKGGFKPPRAYIRHKFGTALPQGATEYEVDHEDEVRWFMQLICVA
jgi:hypothetical protein